MGTRVRRISTGYGLSQREAAVLSRSLMRNSIDSIGAASRPHAIRVLDWTVSWPAQSVEGRVFNQKFGETANERRAVWAPFEPRSFSIVDFVRGTSGDQWSPEGAIRIVHGTAPNEFKSVYNLKQWWGTDTVRRLEGFQPEWARTWDIATIAVDPGMKKTLVGRLVILGMLHALYQLVSANRVDWLVGILADRVYANLDRLGLGLIPLGESKNYLGRDSTPFLLILDRLPASMQARPDTSELLLNGTLRRGIELDSFFDIKLDVLSSST